MKTPSIRFLASLTLLACLCATATAQSPQSEELTLITPVLLNDLSEPLYYRDSGNSYVALQAGLRSRGNFIRLNRAGGIQFFAKQLDAETGITQWKPVVEASWEKDWRSVILLIGAIQSRPFVYPMNDSLQAHPENSIRVVNFTQTRIGMLVGEERKLIDKNKTEVFAVNAYTGANIPLRIILETETNGEWISYMSNVIRMRSNSLRTNYIAYPNTDSRTNTTSIVAFGITGMPPETTSVSP